MACTSPTYPFDTTSHGTLLVPVALAALQGAATVVAAPWALDSPDRSPGSQAPQARATAAT